MLQEQMWIKYAPELTVEWRQMMDEGKDVEHFKRVCEEVAALSGKADCEAVAMKVADLMEKAPIRSDYPYIEPSSYEEIQEIVGKTESVDWQTVMSQEDLKERITGAWIGRISGCLLGKPMECLKTDVIINILKESNNYPMNRYVDSREFSEDLPQKVNLDELRSWQKCWIDRIGGKAPIDDDTNYTVLGMKLIEVYGADFKPDDVLEAWLYWMPMYAACTSERRAYINAAMGLYAPETASHYNPYREWIGAQIRADFFGYICPGNPKKAAWMAWKDGCISHTKNGIYGEMFVAAMLAQAAVCTDVQLVIETGLKEIPSSSRMAQDIRKVLTWYREGVSQKEAFERIHSIYDEYNQHDWCHANSNAMIVAASLLYGEKDFGKTICMSVETGFDTDCNAATAGSVLGMILGEKGIPACWPDGFNKTLRTSIAGYHEVTVDQLADKTMQLVIR